MDLTAPATQPAQERESFLAGGRVIPEHALHGARDRVAVLLFDPSHHHTEVEGLDDDRHAERLEALHEILADLRGEALLHLQAPGVGIHDPRDLGEADDLFIGDVGHMRLAVEREQVVLTERKELDIADNDHLALLGRKESLADDLVDIHLVARGQKAHGFGVALGGVHKPLAAEVLAQEGEILPDIGHHLREGGIGVPGCLLDCCFYPSFCHRRGYTSSPARWPLWGLPVLGE